jgi:hypothetical protein
MRISERQTGERQTDWLRFVLTLLVAVTLLAGCRAADSQQAAISLSPSDQATSDVAEAALAPTGPTLGSQRHGDLLAWLSSHPSQPVKGTSQIDVYLVGTDGQPVSDATVTFDTDMTNMSHGPYLVDAQPKGDGHYVGQVHFSMPGPWRVIAVVDRPGHETAKLRFKFSVNAK